MEIALALVAALGAGVLYWGLVARRESAPEIEEPVAIPLTIEAAPVSLRERLAGPIGSVATPLLRGDRGGRLREELMRADLNFKAAEWASIQAGTGAVLGLFAWWRFGNILVVILAVVLGYLLPNIYLKNRQRQRRNALDAVLGDTIVLMSNGIKAGYSVQQALASVAEGGRPPLSTEIGRLVRETALGIDLEEALQHVNKRLDSKDFDLLVTAILIHRTVGGNLAEVLDKIAQTIRERVRIAGEVRVLTAQARASGYIILALPFAVAGILSIISPSFERPLFTNFLGIVMIALGLISMSIGYAIIRRITDIHI